MAEKTGYLGLTLPANSEYTDSWDKPINKNFELIDAAVETVTDEVQAARFALPTLKAFLEVSINTDGTLKPTEEVTDGANSVVYGSADSAGEDYTLKQRLDLGDWEVYSARLGLTTLLDAMSFLGKDVGYPDTVLEGGADVNGHPTFMSVTTNQFVLNGATTKIVFNINGRRMELQDDIFVAATGADTRKMLVAKVPVTPYVVRSGTGAATLENPSYGSRIQILEDAGADFTALRVRPGMILKITSAISDNFGDYVISEVAVAGNVKHIAIIGIFKKLDSALAYTIVDPLRPEFTSVDAIAPTTGTCIIGEAVLALGNLSSSITYSFKGKYTSDLRGMDVSAVAVVELVFLHNLGRIPSDIRVFASQVIDGSLPSEPLSICGISEDLGVTIIDAQAFNPGVWTDATAPGTQTPSYALPSLTGAVTGTISGSVYPNNAVRIKVTKDKLYLKNIVNNKLYRDYDGTEHNSGFIQVFVQ